VVVFAAWCNARPRIITFMKPGKNASSSSSSLESSSLKLIHRSQTISSRSEEAF
jgi:hypothetical protein